MTIEQDVLIFDFDGTLADTRDQILRNATRVCQALGHDVIVTVDHLARLEPMTFDELGRQLGLDAHDVNVFLNRLLEQLNAEETPPPVFEGLEPVFIRLAGMYRIGIATANNRRVVTRFLEFHHLGQYVKALATVDEPGTKTDHIREVAGLLGGTGRIFMIGDAVSDIRAARAAGVESIAVTWGHQTRERLALESPTYVVDSPEELEAMLSDGRTEEGRESSVGARKDCHLL